MKISRRTTNVVEGLAVDTYDWRDGVPNASDNNRAVYWLNSQSEHSGAILGYENDDVLQRRIEDVAYWIAQRRTLSDVGAKNKPVVISGSNIWISRGLLVGALDARESDLELIESSNVQNVANALAETREAESVYARFHTATSIACDGGAYPALVAGSIGTVELITESDVLVTNLDLGNDEKVYVETQGLTVSPLSRFAKLGKPAVSFRSTI